MGIMGIDKDNRDRRSWIQHTAPATLNDWRDCEREGAIKEGLRACGLGGVTQAQEIVENERKTAALNRYRPNTLCDESEPNKE